MTGHHGLRVGLLVVAVCALVAGSVGVASARTDAGPTASASALSKKKIKKLIRNFVNANRESLRGPAGPAGPKGDKGDKGDPGTGGGAGAVATTKIDYRARQNTAAQDLYHTNGFVIRVDCDPAGNETLTFRTDTNDAQLDSWVRNGTDLNDENFDIGETNSIVISSNAGTISYTAADGKHVDVIFHAQDKGTAAPLGGTQDCLFAATVFTS